MVFSSWKMTVSDDEGHQKGSTKREEYVVSMAIT